MDCRLVPARIAGFAAAALVAAATLLAPLRVATAVDDYWVAQPGAGATIAGATTIRANVTTNSVEEVTRVDVAFLRAGVPYGSPGTLDHRDGPRTGGTSQWGGSLDPLKAWVDGGKPMHNGAYRVQVRVHTSVQGVAQEPTPWQGHEVVFDVAPPSTTATAAVVNEDARTVQVQWQQTAVPDFTRYVIERARDGGAFAPIQEVPSASVTRITDTLPADGRYAYRVTVFRAGGRGGQRSSAPSESSAITVGTADPTPRPTPSPAPAPSNAPAPGATSGPGGGPAPAPGDPPAPGPAPGGVAGNPGEQPSERPSGSSTSPGPLLRRGGSGMGTNSRSATPPRLAEADAPQPQAAPQAGTGDDVFRRNLYGSDTHNTRTVTERHVVQVPGTGGYDTRVRTQERTITVFDREFERREVLPVAALGLLLITLAAHLGRFVRSRLPA